MFRPCDRGRNRPRERARIAPERCIHTHPIKRDRDIRDALDFGVQDLRRGQPDEIRKFNKFRDRAALLLRVSFRSPDAVVDLSRKFGCDAEDVPALLRRRASLACACAGSRFTSVPRPRIRRNTSKPSASARA